jgi:XTP/dITP diphosphohydrolase
MRKLLIATRNKGKFKEIKNILEPINFELKLLSDFKDIPETEEDRPTFRGNAVKKARETSKTAGLLSISDDSGLEVEALNGAPGVRSSRFSGPDSTDKKNIKKLLRLLKDLPPEKRKAEFVCWVALADKGEVLATTKGVCEGKIIYKSRGHYGFGYDPVFVPAGYNKTFAELGLKVKNKISHRVKAFSKMKEIMVELTESKIF